MTVAALWPKEEAMPWVVLLIVLVLAGYFWGSAFLASALVVATGILVWLGAAFAVGTLGFWLVLLAVAVFISYEVDEDEGTKATIALVAIVLFLQLCGAQIAQWVWHNFKLTLWYAGAYLAIGAVWSVVKLDFHLSRIEGKYKKLLEEFLSYNGKDSLGDDRDLKLKWERQLNSNLIDIDKKTRRATFDRTKNERKRTLVMWVAHWPFSMLSTLLRDFVRRLLYWIVDQFGGVYDWVISRHFKDTEGHILTHEEENQPRRSSAGVTAE